MFCRGVFKEDGLEYEGVVKSIASTDDGQYAVVEFVGYGNQEAIWFQDLLKSHGEKARQKQTKEALGEQVPPDNDQEPLKDSTKNDNPAWEIGIQDAFVETVSVFLVAPGKACGESLAGFYSQLLEPLPLARL